MKLIIIKQLTKQYNNKEIAILKSIKIKSQAKVPEGKLHVNF